MDDPNDPFMDGDPADFPHREEAMAEYRALWIQFIWGGQTEPDYVGNKPAPTEEARLRMDALQPLICHGPGPVWRAFTATLPGFREWWDGVAAIANEIHEEKLKR